MYAAGEKKDKNYDSFKFAKLIKKNSNVQVVLIKDQSELQKYLQKNLISNEIVIGMGAGTISKWMYELKNNL